MLFSLQKKGKPDTCCNIDNYLFYFLSFFATWINLEDIMSDTKG